MNWILTGLLKKLLNPKSLVIILLIITHLSVYIIGKRHAKARSEQETLKEVVNHYEQWQMKEPQYEEEITNAIRIRITDGPNDERDSKLLSTRPFKN